MTYFETAKKKFNTLKKNIGKSDIFILSIETSCDETSIAVIKNGNIVLSNVVSSQIEIHSRFGGVVPEVASRNHILAINNVLKESLEKANIELSQIHAIAVTYGAGLMGALLVGVGFAKSLAYSLELPLIKVNHIFGHISANYISTPALKPPYMSLIVSGGHTALINVTKTTKTVIGTTYDDAIGEAYDKVAKVLGLGYPGGPIIDKYAKNGKNFIPFTTRKAEKNDFNFSYSGLKTAVINYIHNAKQHAREIDVNDICYSFQVQAVDEVVYKSINATKKFNYNTLVVAGGVAANSYLREKITQIANESGIQVVVPPISLCTDNAAMIGAEAYESIKIGINLADLELNAEPSINLKYSIKRK